MKALKTLQSNNLLNMKMMVNYLKIVFHTVVKTKPKYKILNFVFQFIKNTKWHFGYTNLEAIYMTKAASAKADVSFTLPQFQESSFHNGTEDCFVFFFTGFEQ